MRLTRVNALLLREISDILHTQFREQAVAITPTEVSITPNLREAHVYYSVLGTQSDVTKAQRFFSAKGNLIRRELNHRVTLKYLPNLHFHHDTSMERGSRVLELLDELDSGKPLGYRPGSGEPVKTPDNDLDQ